MNIENISGILKVLGHPIRLQMVKNLMTNECNVTQIVNRLSIPQSTASQHLKVLTDKGILRPRKDGVKTCYTVINTKVRGIINLLED